MESLTDSLRLPAEDHFVAIRRKNKRLILAFFLLIVAVAIITGGIIVSLIRKHNLESQPSLKHSPGIREYCNLGFECISILTYSIKPRPESTPSQIFRRSLEVVVPQLSRLLAQISSSDSNFDLRFQPEVQSCSSSLRRSVSQLNDTVESMGSNPDEETRTAMLEEVTAAWNDLNRCHEAMESLPLMAAAREEVYQAKLILGYGADFLRDFDMVNFSYSVDKGSSGIDVELLSAATLYGSGYFLLMFLFCLLLRIY